MRTAKLTRSATTRWTPCTFCLRSSTRIRKRPRIASSKLVSPSTPCGNISPLLLRRRKAFAGGLSPSLAGAIRVSPIFAIPVGAAVVGGAGLWSGVAPGLTLLLSVLLVIGGWVTSLCIHEFGHALLAYLGGDRSVAAAGYLSLNPLKYTHPVLSIALPIVFLLIGGIGLPGGAVYLNERAIRSDRWRS